MNQFRLYYTVCFLLFSVALCAQRTEKAHAEYTYHAPENVTVETAKRTALERAKIQAIADEFGTVVSQSNTTFVSNQNGESNIDFFSLGGSEVKGEWIETIGEPEYTISYEQGMLVVKVTVSGRIREIVSAPIDIEAKLLCNGTESKYESEYFKDGDDLFLSFHSPTDGYLAVYLVDASQTAYCLLPYQNQREGIYPINANESYVFFSTKHAVNIEKNIVDEYVMTTSQTAEVNRIYVVFSPNSFCKATDNSSSETLPRELSFEEFQKWLVKCRKNDIKMQVINKEITIKSNN